MQSFSIVIPVYNEAEVLSSQIRSLIEAIAQRKLDAEYEILLVENGSTDSTYRIAINLCKRYPQLRVIRLDYPSYGQAFKAGILQAKYPLIYQFDMDFWDIDFLCMSQAISDRYDVIIGSKNISCSRDGRSIIRRLLSTVMEKAIQWRFRVHLTDVHGLKALKRTCISPLIADVVSPNHFFDSELVLRSVYQGCRVKELPVDLAEIRASRFPFLVRSREAVVECLQLLLLNLKRGKHPNIRLFYPGRSGSLTSLAGRRARSAQYA